ncbi:MAG: SAM-dependent methyltransferase [Opitutales bacterium]|nr:SAM-dependent methyltransferase [Opitutales bacterium]
MVNPIEQYLREHYGPHSVITWAEFIRCALYTPEIGYYTRAKERVGKSEESDFYTATTVGPLFGRLILDACRTLLPDETLQDYSFVEIAVEKGRHVLQGIEHPFKEIIELPLGSELKIPPKAIVFANEWLDAQPFERLIFKDGAWKLRCVQITETELQESLRELPIDFPNRQRLPQTAPDGYELDVPYDTCPALRGIASQPWQGLFLTFDYGMHWEDLCTARPSGTARGYRHHQLVTDLLKHPGETDITCHVIWDWLAEELRNNGFENPQLQKQEAFFMHHAKEEIGRVITRQAGNFSQEKAKLMELLHPNHMGAQFQVLYGKRLHADRKSN